MAEQTKKPPKPKTIKVSIDGREYTVEDREMTVAEVLGLAGKGPASYYLVEIKGKKDRKKYTDPDETIKLKKGSKLVTVFNGETPVS